MKPSPIPSALFIENGFICDLQDLIQAAVETG